MADVRRVDIYIHEISYSQNGSEEDSKIEKSKSPSLSIKIKPKGTFSTYIKNEALSYAKDIIKSQTEFYINRYFNLTDDYIGQRNTNIAKNIINKSITGLTTIATGFAMGGPIGASIAAVGFALTLGLDIANNYIEQGDKLRQMNYQLDFSRVRAGFSLTSGSIGENF